MTAKELTIDEMWGSAHSGVRAFRTAQISNLPNPARRYLEHAIAPETKLASAVRLLMHGEIKLHSWFPFRAEQIIRWDRGMIWNATVRIHGIPIRGFDRIVDGKGEMRWKLFGIIPLMTASGSDITRSAVGRVAAESVWLPSALCGREVSWTAPDSSHPHARLVLNGETTELVLSIDDNGGLKTVRLTRWGNPEGTVFHYGDFGGIVEEEDTFGGYTIPVRLRVGWYFDSPRFESDGEFFRVKIVEAMYK